MPSFTGVSVITDGNLSTTLAVNAGTDSGYHLLVVNDYSRTVQEIPTGETIMSGPFLVGGHKWCIYYCPNGEESGSSDFISLILSRDDDDMEEAVEAKFEFSFVDQVEYQNPIYIRAIETFSFSSQSSFWGSLKFMKRDALERSAYLKDDCFTIRCDIMVCNDLNTSKDADGALSDIHDHFNNLLQNKIGADVTFEVSGETFAAHRCVLAARSKVFMAQLFGPMTEGTTSTVIRIKDMEAKVFAALLSFIYTDSFPDMDNYNNIENGERQEVEEAVKDVMWLQWLQELFVAADRYDIQQLKFLCEKQLSEHIGVNSVGSTLSLAERHHCCRLKEACLNFIQVQSLPCLEKIMATDGWEHITTTYPSLLKELIAKLASNQKKNKKRKR
ncbi:BTB/POZ and MATH domain-containing protein 2-like [Lolium perenne]|uniref:BTB/POZ and MATH domain-containing protein 2-like n=1 Tax=Lolium perenne TaxID=4522 RepID=UPI0021F5D11F|nr:BTB/POZ and MATH domain-containing protein 2-like [Lolium perenne]XP_051212978.1 BTB/POZ and MATH domain-containing protein 2-like [Lolium perenne]XP_051212979.1 BTB/POZ and MATH domain-containing protein 2-like [Lolium perenne]